MRIKDLTFFATTLDARSNIDKLELHSLNFSFPTYSRRMLQETTPPQWTKVFAGKGSVRIYNSTFHGTDGIALEYGGVNDTVENNFFEYNDWSGANMVKAQGGIENEMPLIKLVQPHDPSFVAPKILRSRHFNAVTSCETCIYWQRSISSRVLPSFAHAAIGVHIAPFQNTKHNCFIHRYLISNSFIYPTSIYFYSNVLDSSLREVIWDISVKNAGNCGLVCFHLLSHPYRTPLKSHIIKGVGVGTTLMAINIDAPTQKARLLNP